MHRYYGNHVSHFVYEYSSERTNLDKNKNSECQTHILRHTCALTDFAIRVKIKQRKVCFLDHDGKSVNRFYMQKIFFDNGNNLLE